MAKQKQATDVIAPEPRTRLFASHKIVHGVVLERDAEGLPSKRKIVTIEKDAPLPWDPRDAMQAEEHGLDGLVEGEHFYLGH
jgi:hypothetical protein